MKNAFLILTILMNFNVYAQGLFEGQGNQVAAGFKNQLESGQAAEIEGQKCNADQVDKAATWASTQGHAVSMPGSNNFNECDKMARGHLKTLYRNGNRTVSFDWTTYVAAACKEDCDKPNEFKKCKTEKTALAKKCESVAYVMSFYDRDWNDEEQIQPVSSTASAGTAPKAGGATAAAAATSASAIKCKSEGIETLDYIACKKFATQLDIIDAVQTVAQGTQELVYADKMMDTQTKYAKEENSATGALKATGDSLKMQENMYQQRTAVDATKLAYMYSIYNDMPKMAEIVDKCKNIGSVDPKGLDKITAEECKSYARTGQGGFALAQNQSQIDAMRSKLITIATSAGSNAILASLLGKRASDVKDAIADIDAFVPTDPTLVTEEDALTTYCKLNPGVEKCLTSDLSRTFDTLNDNIITFGEGGTGTNYGSSNGISSGAITDSGTDGGPRASVTPVGSIIAGAAKDNSMEGSTGATVSTGKGPSGGGGGGGLGGGGSGGGGGAPPAAPAQGGVAAAVQGKTPTYGGGAGSISVVGGLGLNKAKGDKTEDNPFGKLFGKDAPKGSGVVNFRDIASQKVGAKGDNLFDMISKRYSSVAADKRLLEYELTK
ncbi:hypothetical protein SHI21_09905 [Bacteriovorax sp. PP10]|uniref:Uncharacterized protein n=1 Tax=Bacteriovorax antarcticus TaxID=3088717 RepID=A0ABU5VVY7_9BACT|nr:hypothetical protein [Bacteriovorax sp. PP10]MEA9356519.1 hypothetical protein [Bacteriovorax sp. PP10]